MKLINVGKKKINNNRLFRFLFFSRTPVDFKRTFLNKFLVKKEIRIRKILQILFMCHVQKRLRLL